MLNIILAALRAEVKGLAQLASSREPIYPDALAGRIRQQQMGYKVDFCTVLRELHRLPFSGKPGLQIG
jgi:hypothetical protein